MQSETWTPGSARGVHEAEVMQRERAVHEPEAGQLGLDHLFHVEPVQGVLKQAEPVDEEHGEAVDQGVGRLVLQVEKLVDLRPASSTPFSTW